MSRPWLKILEWLGRPSFWPLPQKWAEIAIGDPNLPDSLGTMDWRGYLNAERLWQAWGPHPQSPWAPFHCVTLFAAADQRPSVIVGKPPPIGPVAPEPIPPHLQPQAPPPPWLTLDTWTIVDAPGPISVAVGVYLTCAAGAQPACTFDNWPHAKGVLRSERTLAALLHYATRMDRCRTELVVDAPPVWLCDRDRFALPKPAPGRFDNRYYLDDRLMPGVLMLRAAGIRRIVYVTPSRGDGITADLGHHFVEFEQAGFELLHASLQGEDEWTSPRRLAPGKPAQFNAATLALMRSSAGGFGNYVPHPSSGSGG